MTHYRSHGKGENRNNIVQRYKLGTVWWWFGLLFTVCSSACLLTVSGHIIFLFLNLNSSEICSKPYFFASLPVLILSQSLSLICDLRAYNLKKISVHVHLHHYITCAPPKSLTLASLDWIIIVTYQTLKLLLMWYRSLSLF